MTFFPDDRFRFKRGLIRCPVKCSEKQMLESPIKLLIIFFIFILYFCLVASIHIEQNYTLTTTDNDFYSLNLGFAATIPDGIEAYTGTLDAANSKVILNKIEDGIIPAGTAVLVKATGATGDFTFNMTTVGTAVSDIQGVLTDTKASLLAAEGKNVLQFGIKDGVVGFRLPTEDRIIKANIYHYLVVDFWSAIGGCSYKICDEILEFYVESNIFAT